MKSTNAKLKDWFSAWDADQIIGWMDRRKAHRKSRWVRKLNRMLDRYEEEEKRRKENAMTRAELEDSIAALKAAAAGIHEAVQRTVDRMEKDLVDRGAFQPTRTDEHHAYCGNCGCRLPEKIKPRFCHKCGEKVEWK